MAKRAIVLGGGGSRGSYELGAWEALKEMDISFDMVVGTSIGSINAALMAQGDIDLCRRLWENITVDQVMVDGINMYTDVESFFNQKGDIGPFFKRYANNRGADISPLIDLVSRSVSEEKVRASQVRTGLVTVRFPSLVPVELMIEDIPHGKLIDYLIASASVFPAFPIHRIDGEGYVDGGYYDNMPVNLALSNGADEIVCIDLIYKISHPQFIGRPYINYVRPSQSLGTVLLFDKAVLARNRKLGYYDTLRAFGKVAGERFSFDACDVMRHEAEARRFCLDAARFEASLAFKSAFSRFVIGTPLNDAIKKRMSSDRSATAVNAYLTAAELCGEKLGVDPFKLYTLAEFNDALRSALSDTRISEAVDQIQELDLSGLTRLAAAFDKKLLTGCLWRMLRKDLIKGTALHLLTLFPEELLSAFYLSEALGEN